MRLAAVAVSVLYLLPALLPGAVALMHDAYHVVEASAGHRHSSDDDNHSEEAPIHEHGGEPHTHVHANGDPPHSHAPLVDALLIASDPEVEVGPTHALVEIAPGPGLHLPGRSATPALDLAETMASCPSFSCTRADPAIGPTVPPPKA